MAEYAPGTASFAPSVASETYKEYRALNKNAAGTSADEELQAWTWQDGSYSTQYRGVTGGAQDANHQAWSIGGTYATAIPTAGAVTFNGNYRATAKTSKLHRHPKLGFV